MTWNYVFGGLAVRSDIALPGLRSGDGAPLDDRHIRITAEIGARPTPDQVHFAWNGRYRLELGELDGCWLMQSRFDGSFLITRDGRDVRVVCASLPPASEVIEVLLRRVMPRIPILWGATAIHASALAGPGGGVMLIGRSGAGKSTLCAALAHRAGLAVLGDDISLLWDAPLPSIGAGARGVCVWPESRAGLNLSIDRCEPMAGYEGKVRFEPEDSATPPLSPLRAFVLLNRVVGIAAPTIDAISPQLGMAELTPQLIRFNPHGASGKERVDAALRVSRAIRACPVVRLNYPASYDALPEVAALIGPLCDEVGTP